MVDGLRITTVRLAVASEQRAAMGRFYGELLGPPVFEADDGLSVAVGDAEIRFTPSPGAPFYHFALLAPGDRFAAACTWLAARVPLLHRAEDDRSVFDFEFWDAQACYVHDPAGNIVEIIAHRGLAEAGGEGDFAVAELCAISEVGLVVDDPAAAVRALDAAGVPLWFGDVAGPVGLGFAGRRAHTLIVCAAGRPWLPTGRSAQPHPLRVTLAEGDGTELTVRVDDSGRVAAEGPDDHG